MKKLYALIAFAVVTSLSASAQLARKTGVTKQLHSSQSQAKKSPVFRHSTPTHNTTNAIWSDDFSTPANWTIAHEAGTTGDWAIGTTGPSGSFPIDPIASSTAANGFAIFDSDLICSGNQIGNLTTAAPIDLTGHSAVRLTFSQYYCRYFDSTYVYVSTDNVNWTKFEVNGNLTINQFSANDDFTVNPEIYNVDISSAAANQATVYLRFTFYSPTSNDTLGRAGCAYAWMIDDVSLNDIPSLDAAALPNVFQGEYSCIPLADAAAFTVQGRIVNTGATSITSGNMEFNVYSVAGAIFNSVQPIPGSILPGDTSAMIVSALAFTPADTGIYMIEQISSVVGDVEANNDTVYSFVYVDDSTYARDFAFLDGNTAGGFGFNANTGILGQVYHNYQVTSATSATAFFAGPTEGDSVTFSIYSMSAGLPGTEIAVTDVYVFTADDAANGVLLTLPYSTPVALAAGTDYFLACNQINSNNITLVASNDIYTDSKIFYDGGAGWNDVASNGGVQLAFVLRLNTPYATLNNVGSVKNTADFSVYPNPSKGSIFVMSNGLSSNVTVNVINAMGQVVKTSTFSTLTNEKIDLSNQAAGTYTVQFITDKGVSTKSVVIASK